MFHKYLPSTFLVCLLAGTAYQVVSLHGPQDMDWALTAAWHFFLIEQLMRRIF